MTTATIRLTDIANGGASMGRDENNRVIFVPHSIPGELVRVELVEEKKRYAQGRLVKVLEPSSHRISARCPHYGLCDGCHFQHIEYNEQLRLKRAIVIDQMARIGGLSDPEIKSIISSPDPWSYSNFVTFRIDRDGRLGYWSTALNKVMAVSTCPILQPSLLNLLEEIILEDPALQQLSARLGVNDIMMVILFSDDYDPPALETDMPVSIALSLPDGSYVSLIGDSHIFLTAKGREFRVSPGSFFYPNSGALESLIATVMRFADLTGQEHVLELYSGVGTLTAFLAPHAREIVGIEANQAAVEDAAENLDEFENVVLYSGTVEEILPSLELTPDVMLIESLEGGISTEVHHEIGRIRPTRLIVIGSDLARFARDSQHLSQSGYDLVEVQPIDMYPHNYRILAAALWGLGAGRRQ